MLNTQLNNLKKTVTDIHGLQNRKTIKLYISFKELQQKKNKGQPTPFRKVSNVNNSLF
jgi:hypothetical protein